MGTELVPMPFDFEGTPVRVVRIDGQPWWVAFDVAKILGHRDTNRVLRLLDDDMKGTHSVGTPGGPQQMHVITKGAVYRLIMRSRRPEAVRFERLVVDEILPSIAETGSYSLPAPIVPVQRAEAAPVVPQNYKEALIHLLAKVEENEALTRRLETTEAHVLELAPSAEAWDSMASAEGGTSITAAAKILKGSGCRVEPKEFFAYLAGKRWIYRAGRIGVWTAHQSALNAGYMEEKLGGWHEGSDGKLKQNPPSARITAAGMQRIREMLLAERGSWMAAQLELTPRTPR